jgi:thioesterase domain-containing protein
MRALATRLTTDRPVYGVWTGPADPTVEPQHRLPEMAARCLESIRSRQHSGPYALVGHSFGGLLAFEIAQRLQAQGEEVELLGLIDAPAPRRWHSWRDRWTVIVSALREAAVEAMLRYLRRVTSPSDSWAIGVQAAEAYRARPYAGSVIFFAAEKRDMVRYDSPRVWRRLVLGGVTVAYVPGGHLDGLEPPNVDVLAAQLSAELEKASAREIGETQLTAAA